MTTPAIHSLTLPGPMLRRGFWLYVWRVETPRGEMLYVGRTGDNSSPNAAAPYARMGQHLGSQKTQNMLRVQLEKRGIDPQDCENFHLIACGPLYPEVEKEQGLDRKVLMARHMPIRNLIGSIEKALADALSDAGYDVLNTVIWKHPLNERLWRSVRTAFAEHFPELSSETGSGGHG